MASDTSALDFNPHLGTVLRTITNYPTMAIIAVDNANQLLAGISLERPDTLRLLNISPVLSTPLEHDTEFFLSDNANDFGAGQFDFAGGRHHGPPVLSTEGLSPSSRNTEHATRITPHASRRPPPAPNAFRNISMLFGTAVSGSSFPSISSETYPV